MVPMRCLGGGIAREAGQDQIILSSIRIESTGVVAANEGILGVVI